MWVEFVVGSRPCLVQSLNSPFFPPHTGAEPGRAKRESGITCMHMLRTPPFPPSPPKIREKTYLEVILDSLFARPGSAPVWGGKKGEFRDWASPCAEDFSPSSPVFLLPLKPTLQIPIPSSSSSSSSSSLR